eukprot:5218117-Pleurochrysis_carterae.AAC.1
MRADIAEKQDYVKHKPVQAFERQLAKLFAKYTKAMAVFVPYLARAAFTLVAARAHLATLLPLVAKQHVYLPEQIEMRVLGVGLTEHPISWSSGGRQCSNDELLAALRRATAAETRLRADGALPTEAAAPRAKPNTFKQLGTQMVDSKELAKIEEIDAVQLKAALQPMQRARPLKSSLSANCCRITAEHAAEA